MQVVRFILKSGQTFEIEAEDASFEYNEGTGQLTSWRVKHAGQGWRLSFLDTSDLAAVLTRQDPTGRS